MMRINLKTIAAIVAHVVHALVIVGQLPVLVLRVGDELPSA